MMNEAVARGAVLVHCTIGYRSSAYALAYLGRQQHRCTDWAVQEASKVGFSFDKPDPDGQKSVLDFFQAALGC